VASSGGNGRTPCPSYIRHIKAKQSLTAQFLNFQGEKKSCVQRWEIFIPRYLRLISFERKKKPHSSHRAIICMGSIEICTITQIKIPEYMMINPIAMLL